MFLFISMKKKSGLRVLDPTVIAYQNICILPHHDLIWVFLSFSFFFLISLPSFLFFQSFWCMRWDSMSVGASQISEKGWRNPQEGVKSSKFTVCMREKENKKKKKKKQWEINTYVLFVWQDELVSRLKLWTRRSWTFCTACLS